ncbi:MAG: carbohydrate ABC transporter permease [Chloroflexota bacterium]
MATAQRTVALAGPRGRRRKFDWLPYLMVAPTVIVLSVFSLAPTVYGAIVSLYNVQFVQLLAFVGLDNYISMLTSPDFWQSFRVSITFTAFSVVLTVGLGFGLALLANRSNGLVPAFRTLVVVPWVTSYVVVYLIFKWILNYDDGLINVTLAFVGLAKVAWLTNPTLALGSLIVVDTWRAAPYAMIILLAGLQTIPGELYEAAATDGASGWHSFWSMTLPLMKLPLAIVLVLITIVDFNTLVAMLVLTGGGPGRATEPLSLLMYLQAFEYFQMGPAASIAMFIFALNLALSAGYVRLLRSE